MTAREAFTFFRGSAKVQARLKRLIDVGLDYVRLGQPAHTLSGGEGPRLKPADYLIALGPGASDEGGRVVAKGTPEMVSRTADSVTGRFLAEVLGRDGE